MFEIQLIYDNNNTGNQTDFYIVSVNEFYNTNTRFIIETFVFAFRDGLGLIFILIINLVLLVDFKKTMDKKKALLKYKTNDGRIIKNSTENRLVLITLLNFFVGIIGHVPNLVFVIVKNSKNFYEIYDPILKILIKILLFSTKISFCLNIFIFYFGNKRFRYHLNKFVKRLLRIKN
jgi:hypothetical protein